MSPRGVVRLAAGAGALVMALTSSGDALVVAVLLGLAAWDPAPALVAVAAGAIVWLRIGAASLDALAGTQAAVGAAVATGPVLAAVASGGAALALLAWGAAGRDDAGTATGSVAAVAGALAVAASAAMAVAVAAGPGPRTAGVVLARLGLTLVMVAAATALKGRMPGGRVRRSARAGAVLAGALSVALAGAALPGRWAWPPAGVLAAGPTLTGAARAMAGAALAVVVAWTIHLRRPAAPLRIPAAPLRLPTAAPPLVSAERQ